MTTYRLTHPRYRADIDGVRALAILAVVVFHYFPAGLPGGFIGVDVFFVISGFLISGNIMGDLEHNRFSFLDFYRRRIRRIFPALLLVLIATLFLGWFALIASRYEQLGKHVAAGASFVPNLVYWDESGYFDNQAITKPLQHLWSLGVEEQFYVIWPLILWSAWRARKSLLFIVLFVGVGSFLLNVEEAGVNAAAAFYSPLTRIWELLVGTALACLQLYERRRKPTGALSNVFSVIGLMLVVAGLLTTDKNDPWPGFAALLPVGGSALILAAGAEARPNQVILSNPLMVWIGLISYPLYLWHWPLLSFAHLIAGTEPSFSVRALVLLISLCLAWLTFNLVERPLRRLAPGNAVAGSLVALMVSVGFTGYLFFTLNGLPFRTAEQNYFNSTSQVVRRMLYQRDLGWPFRNNELCRNKYPLYTERKELRDWFCMLNRDASPDIIILGNSFANHLYPGLVQSQELAEHTILSIGSCEAADVSGVNFPSSRSGSGICGGGGPVKQQAQVDGIIRSTNTIKYAILSGLNRDPDQIYTLRLKKRIDFLESYGIKVIVFVPHVVLDQDVARCFEHTLKDAEDCGVSVTKRKTIDKNFTPVIRYLSKTNPTVLFFDPNNLFCNEKKCLPIRDGVPLYRDKSHLSEYGSVKLAKIFVEWAKKNAPAMFREHFHNGA